MRTVSRGQCRPIVSSSKNDVPPPPPPPCLALGQRRDRNDPRGRCAERGTDQLLGVRRLAHRDLLSRFADQADQVTPVSRLVATPDSGPGQTAAADWCLCARSTTGEASATKAARQVGPALSNWPGARHSRCAGRGCRQVRRATRRNGSPVQERKEERCHERQSQVTARPWGAVRVEAKYDGRSVGEFESGCLAPARRGGRCQEYSVGWRRRVHLGVLCHHRSHSARSTLS